jgi:hypothetical protein
MLKKYILLTLIIVSLGIKASAYNDLIGTTAGAYLKISEGVRASSMGGTFVALSNDTSAIYFNPSGLVQLKTPEFSSMYNSWFQGISLTTMSYARPVNSSESFGVSVTYLCVGEIEETTMADQRGTGKVFTPSDTIVTLSYGRRIARGLLIGCSLKYINDNIDSSMVTGYGLDIGVIFATPINRLHLGAAIKNIGGLSSGLLPTTFTYGIAYRMLPKDALILVCDLDIPSDDDPSTHIGAEYYPLQFLCLRCGFNTMTEEYAGGNFSAGLGLVFDDLSVDYAFAPYGELGDTHRASFKLRM